MSHFRVNVFIAPTDIEEKIPAEVEKALYPFFEQPEEGDPRLELNDHTEEWKNEYETGTYTKEVEPQQINEDTGRPVTVEAPLKERYASFEIFVDKWHGGVIMQTTPNTIKVGHWSNPKAKWDWYQIGGRYSGQFITRHLGATDICRICDLDLEEMKRRQMIKRDEHWDKSFNSYLADLEVYRSGKWKINPRPDGSVPTPEEAAAGRIKFIYGINPLKETKPQYMARVQSENPLHSWAILTTDGRWLERGRMGWWAMSDAMEESEAEFEKRCQEYFNTLSPDTWIVSVDCHI